MKKGLVLLGLLAVLLACAPGRAWAQEDCCRVFMPLVAARPAPSALLADHRHTDIRQIPDEWIERAKIFVVHYAHTSHGGQVLEGLRWLEQRDPKYNVAIRASGLAALPDDSSALRFYDGNNYPGNTYITPEMYWQSADGLSHTRSVANTGWFGLSTWSWCGQMSSYPQASVQAYLDALAALEQDYPAMRFIYMTGHTDGSPPQSASALWRNNGLVRQYVQDNHKVLFDFADIESYDPDGVFYPVATDACPWCQGWCDAHPGHFSCQSLPSCAHSHGLQCALKAQAFWYLMARLAGWDGTPAPQP